jgi:hypothetical protein
MHPPKSLPVSRLPKQTLHHVWSPKLQRILVLTWVKIPMKYFTVAAKASLLISSASDSPALTFDIPFWTSMIERSRYVLAQKAGSTTLSAISR